MELIIVFMNLRWCFRVEGNIHVWKLWGWRGVGGGVRYGEGDMQGIISGVFLVGGILVRASEPWGGHGGKMCPRIQAHQPQEVKVSGVYIFIDSCYWVDQHISYCGGHIQSGVETARGGWGHGKSVLQIWAITWNFFHWMEETTNNYCLDC